ncbi:MAG: GNAT family N-acetyltransferase [Paracoccaceae bacterium]
MPMMTEGGKSRYDSGTQSVHTLYTEMPDIRAGRPGDALTCATILNRWIDATDWMPRVHSADDVERHYRDFVFREREVYVIGNPARAYISLSDEDEVTSLYSAVPGQGHGKALIDHAKTLRPRLSLWTFESNTGAQRFYLREGFAEVERSAGDNEEKLPDIRYEWGRA